MSAAIMDGETQRMSGVINIEEVKSSSSCTMQYDDRVLVEVVRQISHGKWF
jgi:L-asparaginase